MYSPKGNSKEKTAHSVAFTELEPPLHLRGIVHRFLELKTTGPLAQDYRFHALPDACTYVVFDQSDRKITGVTKLRAVSEEFNLGRSFHFINIRLLPGVWKDSDEPVLHGLLDRHYGGALPLIALNDALATQGFADGQSQLIGLVEDLMARNLVAPNPVTEKIFQHLDELQTVSDMAAVADLSPRQLQRTLKQTTGFTPHDFLKVLRLQQSLNGNDTWSYADQSHFIHSFRKATGYTPGKFARKFDV